MSAGMSGFDANNPLYKFYGKLSESCRVAGSLRKVTVVFK